MSSVDSFFNREKITNGSTELDPFKTSISEVKKIKERVNVKTKSAETNLYNFLVDGINSFENKHARIMTILQISFYIVYFILFNWYMFIVITNKWHETDDMCDGVKILTYTTLFLIPFFIYFWAIKPLFGKIIKTCITNGVKYVEKLIPFILTRKFNIIFGCLICLGITIPVIINSKQVILRCISFSGILIFILLGYIFSNCRDKVNWKTVVWGHVIQFLFGYIFLQWPMGNNIMQCTSGKVVSLIQYTNKGSDIIFGYLSHGRLEVVDHIMETTEQVPLLAFKAFTAVIFISVVCSILFYYGILPWLIIKLGWLLQKIMCTTAVETMAASANIFLGMVETPLTVRPYLLSLTKSELHSLMAGGFATMAGTVFAAYVAMGVNSAHLMVASFMSCPAALAYSKLFYPETEESQTTAVDIARLRWTSVQSVIEAITKSIIDGLVLYLNILGNLIGFLTLTNIVSRLLEMFSSLLGSYVINLEILLSYIFSPLALIMGVEWDECKSVGDVLGLKTIVNGFVAFIKLLKLREESKLTYRSEMIATYALCSFANTVSMGIMVGGMGSLLPTRLSLISSMVLRSLVTGSVASFVTACVAGVLMEDNEK